MTANEFEKEVQSVYLTYSVSERKNIWLSVYKGNIRKYFLGFSRLVNPKLVNPKRVVLIYNSFKEKKWFSQRKIRNVIDGLINFEKQKFGFQASASEVGTSMSKLVTSTNDCPFCSICGHLTVRSGTCFKCLNCGNSEGCS